MITLITGTPGAGKTLYCISKLLRGLVGSVVKSQDSNGNPVDVPRRILTNIPGLLLDHELIDNEPGGGLSDWFSWCKPGDVIVFDEVQRCWPPRPNGSKVPDYISALETHRHKGVDFIILTQNPLLLDRNVLALVGRHLHVRRFGAVGAAIVYEWDHCSRQLMYSKALKKSPFKYDKSVFKLYKSAELHTKPKASVPPLVYVILFALVAAAFLIPNLAARISGKSEAAVSAPSDPAHPGRSSESAPSPSASSKTGEDTSQAYDPTSFVPRVSYEPLSAPAYDAIRVIVNMPIIIGGVCFKGECKCYTQQGTDSGISSRECKTIVDRPRFDPYTVQQVTGRDAASGKALADTAPTSGQTGAAHQQTATSVPVPSGWSNPRAELAQPSPFQLSQQRQQGPAVDLPQSMPQPSILNPHRKT